MDGTNGSTTFTDESNNALSVTPDGAQISTAQSKFGGASCLLDGTSDSLSLSDTSALRMESGDFTIEFWIYFNSIASYQTPFDKGYTDANGIVLQTGNGTGRLIAYVGGSAVITESGTGSTGSWIHYALVRSGTSLTLYRDGVSSGTATNSTNLNSTDTVYIGRGNVGNLWPVNGYIDDFRITKGVARYTSDFTPPFGAHPAVVSSSVDPYINNVALLLHMDGANGSTIFTDNSSNAFTQSSSTASLTTSNLKFGTAGGDFSTNGDTVRFANDPAFRFGTGDFTIEGWFKPISTGTSKFFCGLGLNASDGFLLAISTTQAIFRANGTSDLTVGSLSISTTKYTHVAWVRNGDTRSIFVDGVLVGSNTLSFDVSNTSDDFVLGSIDTAGGSFRYIGYIDEFRVTKGVARYTADFVPQDAPFEDAVTDGYFDDVVLLLHGDGTDGSTTVTDDSVSAKTVTAYGSSVISTTRSKFGGSGLYFPGATTDFMSTPNSTDWAFGTGDVTVEAWVYIDANSPQDAGGNRSCSIVNTWTSAGSIVGWNFFITGDGSTTGTGLGFDSWDGSGNATQFRATTTVSQQTWHHIAATVESGTRRLFLDGTLLSGTTNTIGAGYTTFLANTLNIGVTPNSGYPLPLNGYVDDLRITKGIARYTTDFTPPIAPFPNFSPSTEAWTPSQTATRLWIDADDASSITETSNAVSQWNDKSGNGFHFVQATGSEQPTLTANGLNSKPVITFATDHMDAPGYAIATQPFTIIFIATDDGGGNFSYVYDTATTRVIFSFENNNNARNSIYAGTAWLSNNNAILDTNPHIFTATYNGASSSLDVDDVGLATGNPGSASITNGMTLGKHNNGSDNPMNGYIAELVIVENATGPLIEKIQGYLAHKWGLTANLPNNHPYKTSAP